MLLSIAISVLFALLAFGVLFWARKLFRESQKHMQTVFQSLSFNVMEQSQRTFLDLARATFDKAQSDAKSQLDLKQQSFEALFSPLKSSMEKLDQHQRELEQKRESSYASLSKQIEGMMQAQLTLHKETNLLASALRSPPLRGAWGQVHLRRVVELAGLLNQCDFTEQVTVESEGKTWRPDLIVHLPGARQIVVDAKTPLIAYLEAAEIQEEGQRKQKLEMHAAHVKKHIRDLSQKEYWKRFDLNPEFVVLFLPAESFFSAALQIDPTLIELGAQQNIIVATPTTLIAILRAVAQCWKQEAISKNAEQIARLGQELYERLSVLSEHWNKVGKSLGSAVDAYNSAISSLEKRVLVSARKLKEHGAAPIKGELEELEPIDKLVRQ